MAIIDVQGLNLTGLLPTNMGALTDLMVLRLSDNPGESDPWWSLLLQWQRGRQADRLPCRAAREGAAISFRDQADRAGRHQHICLWTH